MTADATTRYTLLLRRCLIFPVLIATAGQCNGRSADTGPVVASGAHAAAPVAGEAYRWRPVAIGAGGFITGLSFDATGKTMAIRTDVYGAYVWDTTADRWRQVIDAASMPAGDLNKSSATGVYEITVAPGDSDRLYMAFKGFAWVSTDRGYHWTRGSGPFPTPFDANSPFRMHGPFMAVSPANPNLVLFGSPAGGLTRSVDGGRTWLRVSSVPGSIAVGAPAHPGADSAPGAMIWFAPQSHEVWVMAPGSGMFRSVNDGASFARLASVGAAPTLLRHGAFGRDGAFWGVDAHSQKLWVYRSGAWTDLIGAGAIPAKKFTTLAIDPVDGAIFVFDEGGRVWQSVDGASFASIARRVSAGPGDPPWLQVADQGYVATAIVAFDPAVPGQMWSGAGTGVYFARRGSSALNWQSRSRGIEELVANDVLSLPGQAPLFAAWDFGIHRKPDLNRFSTGFGPRERVVIAAQQVAGTPADTNFAVTNASDTRHCCAEDGMTIMAGYTTDNGQTWTRFAALPTPPGTDSADPWRMAYGMIAVASDSTDNIIWAPSLNRSPFYTMDRGRTWTRVALPGEILPFTGSHSALYLNRKVLVADPVLPATFYYYHGGEGANRALQGLWVTQDGGAHWSRRLTGEIAPASVFSAKLRAMPGHAGTLFFTSGVTSGDTALRRSSDGGATWQVLQRISAVDDVAFGKPAQGVQWPTIFVSARIDGQYGIWRSIDNASSWHQITTFPTGTLDQVTVMEGDKDVFGRVYIGYKGSGWRYGEPADCHPAAYQPGHQESCDAVP
ncbi:WD40/YVTN/BNR-like repeat-containing protein [Novosphingobium sp.]|uniref:WD40/YVTN/BNR-like repeat-containing protein n=1 Tax=Novosphingobium sp. TaxID=1874826 RepID=UPI003D12FE4B